MQKASVPPQTQNGGAPTVRNEKGEKLSKKVLTNRRFGAIIGSNLNITNKDCDEEGRRIAFAESCRLVQDNDGLLLMAYRF